ncbi:MAG TPA: anti-sigma factor [Burkholderiales bacterium]|nr:anti-sigma factor [Burkholderiales bacterium]
MRTDDRLHAYLDGELDAASALELEREMAQNPALRASVERLRELSAAVRTQADYHRAPARLKRAPHEKRRWFVFAPAFAMALLLGAGIALYLERPGEDTELVASHVRATLGNRLIDVASSDQHTVKPWLSARLPYSPPVADLSSEGYPLAGARIDYVAGKQVAVLVYYRRLHTIDVYVWPGEEASGGAFARDGFNVEHFTRGGMRYALVSDLNRNELRDFAKLLN